ncbi:MAG TPA: RDD family protein [Candidatus Nanoarchaeia archaeon]|nr:RDD family protein [Candidatus Nanoarchaeia archaeon]
MPKKSLKLPIQQATEAPANVIKRFLAFVIDIILLSFLVSPLQGIILQYIPPTASYAEIYGLIVGNSELVRIMTTISLLVSAVFIIYFSVLEYKLGQTLGKMVFKLHVVSELKKLNYWQCMVRNLFLLPIFPLIFLWIIDPLYVIFTQHGRRLSDIIAKTRVVEYYRW